MKYDDWGVYVIYREEFSLDGFGSCPSRRPIGVVHSQLKIEFTFPCG